LAASHIAGFKGSCLGGEEGKEKGRGEGRGEEIDREEEEGMDNCCCPKHMQLSVSMSVSMSLFVLIANVLRLDEDKRQRRVEVGLQST